MQQPVQSLATSTQTSGSALVNASMNQQTVSQAAYQRAIDSILKPKKKAAIETPIAVPKSEVVLAKTTKKEKEEE